MCDEHLILAHTDFIVCVSFSNICLLALYYLYPLEGWGYVINNMQFARLVGIKWWTKACAYNENAS